MSAKRWRVGLYAVQDTLDEKDPTPSGSWRAVIAQRAQTAGIDFELNEYEDDIDDKGRQVVLPDIELSMPNGRKTRDVTIDEDVAEAFAQSAFEEWTFLGDYAAILDRSTDTIEALIQVQGGGVLASQVIQRFVASHGTPVQEGDDSSEKVLRLDSHPSSRLKVEIGEPTPSLVVAAFNARMRSRAYSIRIIGSGARAHDAALGLLEDVSRSLFFEIDVTKGFVLILTESRHPVRLRAGGRSGRDNGEPPRLPRLSYSAEAAILYNYGRSASEMPLLEFLAYYQVIEYYFPAYARAEAIQRLRQLLLDPRFNPMNDVDVGKLLQAPGSSSRSGALTEVEQLKATIRRCTDDISLTEFITARQNREQFLTGKQELVGVKSLNFSNRDYALTDQVAERIYQIRCRIVHSKEDGGPSAAPLLLPFSAEARKMRVDIELARYVAQKVLIAGAQLAGWVARSS